MKAKVKISYILDEQDKKDIKHQMIDKGLNLTQMSRILGVSKAYLSEIINGKRDVTKRIIEQFDRCGIVLKFDDTYRQVELEK